VRRDDTRVGLSSPRKAMTGRHACAWERCNARPKIPRKRATEPQLKGARGVHSSRLRKRGRGGGRGAAACNISRTISAGRRKAIRGGGSIARRRQSHDRPYQCSGRDSTRPCYPGGRPGHNCVVLKWILSVIRCIRSPEEGSSPPAAATAACGSMLTDDSSCRVYCIPMLRSVCRTSRSSCSVPCGSDPHPHVETNSERQLLRGRPCNAGTAPSPGASQARIGTLHTSRLDVSLLQLEATSLHACTTFVLVGNA